MNKIKISDKELISVFKKIHKEFWVHQSEVSGWKDDIFFYKLMKKEIFDKYKLDKNQEEAYCLSWDTLCCACGISQLIRISDNRCDDCPIDWNLQVKDSGDKLICEDEGTLYDRYLKECDANHGRDVKDLCLQISKLMD